MRNGNDINQCRVTASEHTRCNRRPAGYQTRSPGASDSALFKPALTSSRRSPPDTVRAVKSRRMRLMGHVALVGEKGNLCDKVAKISQGKRK